MLSIGKSAFSLTLLSFALTAVAAPTVFPTGTTIYDPARTWNGFTVMSILDTPAVLVLDMNGRVVKQWDGFNLSPGGPARILPGGIVMGSAGTNPPHQEALQLLALDFDGKPLWSFDRNLQITTAQGASVWSTRQHHDWQRIDFPAGYYSPGVSPRAQGSNTLMLTHINHINPAVSDKMLEDDRLIEVNPAGDIVWEWLASDHIGEFRFDAEERAAIYSAPTFIASRGSFDWLHANSATYVGPNHWFDEGDTRFAPDNVIISSREASVVAVIARDGKVVWQLGPDFSRTPQEAALRQIIGQHHAHFIPPGLPGAGNVLVFDNGGSSGYGAPSPIGPNGNSIYARATSRILEINPVTLELVWSYAAANFFSTNISGAQRLPNGNTLITGGAPGRVFEITSTGEIVWEYMNPPGTTGRKSNGVYRAYRLPYEWIPQLPVPEQTAVVPPAPGTFRVHE